MTSLDYRTVFMKEKNFKQMENRNFCLAIQNTYFI